MAALGIIVGLALLLFGRQLFWLFVGGVGFLAGLQVASSFFQGQPQWWALAVALVAGLIGAVLAIVLQKLAIGIAGFLAGATALFDLATRVGHHDLAWLGWIVGGIIGALLVLVLFDWALIVLSALAGAVLITELIQMEPSTAWLVLAGLFILGVLVQATQLQRQPPPVPAENRAVE